TRGLVGRPSNRGAVPPAGVSETWDRAVGGAQTPGDHRFVVGETRQGLAWRGDGWLVHRWLARSLGGRCRRTGVPAACAIASLGKRWWISVRLASCCP